MLRPAIAAMSFLTSIPVGRFVRIEAKDVARGAWLFPLVGGAVGAISGLTADLAADWLPPLAAGALAVGVAALLTGGMHLDALADAADALGSKTRERALEIMRDHAIGAFGATALIVVLMLDAALFAALGESDDAAVVGLAAGAGGRAAMVVPAVVLPYARAGEGQGRGLAGLGPSAAVAAVVVASLLVLPTGTTGLLMASATGLVAVVLSLMARRRFGGVTGDVLGAIGKLAETAALVAATLVLV